MDAASLQQHEVAPEATAPTAPPTPTDHPLLIACERYKALLGGTEALNSLRVSAAWGNLRDLARAAQARGDTELLERAQIMLGDVHTVGNFCWILGNAIKHVLAPQPGPSL